MPRYIPVTDTAKMIRKGLREAFPGVKFSVRSDKYAGGASIRIRWADGPTVKQVDALTKRFAGSGFDGMQDLKYSLTSYLAGEPVRFGGDFVFTERRLSRAFVERFGPRAVAKTEAWSHPYTWTITGSDEFGYHLAGHDEKGVRADHHAYTEVNRALEAYTLAPTQNSPTIRKVGTHAEVPGYV